MATSPTDVFPSPASPDGRSSDSAGHSAFLIRAARQQDLHSLTELLARGFHSPDGPMGWMYPLLRLGIYEDLRNRLNSKSFHHACLVAVPYANSRLEQYAAHASSGQFSSVPLVGTIEIAQRTYAFWQPRRTRYLYISNLAVQAEYRRQGVARQLLATCERIAVEWKIPDLYLHVLENNHSARQLYFKAGYRLKQVDTGISSWLLGQPRQLFLHKRLSSKLFQ